MHTCEIEAPLALECKTLHLMEEITRPGGRRKKEVHQTVSQGGACKGSHLPCEKNSYLIAPIQHTGGESSEKEKKIIAIAFNDSLPRRRSGVDLKLKKTKPFAGAQDKRQWKTSSTRGSYLLFAQTSRSEMGIRT